MTLIFIHIIPRSVAKQLGIKRYALPVACKNGHLSERNTRSSTCIACDRQAKAATRAASPERAREISRISRAKHAEKRRLENQIWREKNKVALSAKKKEYRESNKEKVARSKARYYRENKEKCLEVSRLHREGRKEQYAMNAKIWRKNNREAVRCMNRARKLKIKGAIGSHSIADILHIKSMQKSKCAACYKKVIGESYHVDHIKPISLGGENWPSNLQILCPFCNMSKGAKPPEEFYQRLGFLL
jgi:5-methylcytosine-specific restriction endonuclease McrA